MRILLVQRYFWPDVGAPASMLRAIATRLAADGHEVTVLSSMPVFTYGGVGPPTPKAEMLDGFRVIRVKLPRPRKGRALGRVIDIVAFSSMAAGYLLLRGRRFDLVSVSSEPPVILPAAVRIIARLVHRPYVYHCQDLNPEAALLAGLLREGWRARFLAHLDRANVRRAVATVVLSRDMEASLRARGVGCHDVAVINNFVTADDRPSPSLPPELRKPKGVFRVLFAGNLGLLQDLDSVLEAARQLRSYDAIEFAFVGAGVRAAELKARAGDMLGHSVVFFPDQTPDLALEMMREADLGLVTLAPGVYQVAYPSKTLAYLEAGCPILAAVEDSSELAELVGDAGAGVTCPPSDAAALAEAVLRQQSYGSASDQTRARVREICTEYFGQERALDKWSGLYARLARDGVPFQGGGEG